MAASGSRQKLVMASPPWDTMATEYSVPKMK